MSGLPERVVTFVFTDVEGSIRLWNDEPDRMMEALNRHDLIIDEVVARHNGHSVKLRGEGDSRFLVFGDARDAVAAVSEMQVQLWRTNWPTTRSLAIRAAVHTGDATLQDGDYYGPAVNRTARIRDLAAGGQSLISHVTMELLGEDLPEGVTATDLGEHTLRDLPGPEHIWQLNPPGLPVTFQLRRVPSLSVRLLGALEVESDGIAREVTSPRQRAILALLAIHAGQPVPWERLIEDVWGDAAPASGKKTVAFHISQLRDTLQPDRTSQTASPITTSDGGYVLDVRREDVDLHLFKDLVDEARELSTPEARSRLASEALTLWRGEPFSEMRYENFTQGELARLEDLKLEAHEIRAGALLELGDAAAAVDQIAGLVEDQPYRESLALLYARALYASSRQADALAVIEDTRSALREDLGLDLGPELASLEQDILAQSPELAPRAQPAPRRGFLPVAPDRFVGRETELFQIQSLFDHSRLITLVGLGGIGKSRLALEAARRSVDRFVGGAWLLELARVRRGHHVLNVLADTLDLGDVARDEVTEAAIGHIGDSRALLVVDNCEHVSNDVAGFVSQMMSSCPDVHFLATSRVPLGVQGERTLPVGPLGVDAGTAAAKELFVERAMGVSHDFEPDSDLIAEICSRVGGIPLAIELAASWLRVLSLEQLDHELAQQLDLVSSPSRAVPERQRALTSVIDWSMDAAGLEARSLLEGLSVFRGGFTLEGAMALAEQADRLATLGHLDGLVSQSLVIRERAEPGDMRFGLLEPVREYAGSKLREAGRYEEAVRRHREFVTKLMADAYEEISGGEQQRWMSRLDLEADNIRAALDRAMGQPEKALPLASRFWRYCLYRGRAHEGLGWLEPLLDGSMEQSSDLVLGLYGHGVLASNLGRLDAAEGSLVESRRGAYEMGDLGMVAWSNTALSGVRYLKGDAEGAAALLEQSIETLRRSGDTAMECLSACKLAHVLDELGRGDEAHELLEEAAIRCDVVPPYIEAELCLARGLMAVVRGDLAEARELIGSADEVGRSAGFVDQQAWAQFGLGNVALADGDPRAARAAYSTAIRMFEVIGEMEGIVLARAHLAAALALTGQAQQARDVLAHSLESAEANSPIETAIVLEAMAVVEAACGDGFEAVRNLGSAASIRRETATLTRPPLLALVRSAEQSTRDVLGDELFAETSAALSGDPASP